MTIETIKVGDRVRSQFGNTYRVLSIDENSIVGIAVISQRRDGLGRCANLHTTKVTKVA